MMRRASDAGKKRTANKVRSFMRAAYETAKSARVDAAVPLKFKAYAVALNPAAEAKVIRGGNRSAKNALEADEMRTYWRVIKAVPGVRGAALRLHLLTGAQRLEQLVRLAPADIADDLIVLYDGKGRPGEAARKHPVPLLPLAAKALKECATMGGTYALSTGSRKEGKRGSTHISGTTLSGWAQAAATGIPGFKAKNLRSGVETLLASAGISDAIRGRLQSHGISGVQDRHYNAYEYMAEKREALETLLQLLEQRSKKTTRTSRRAVSA
jgi:integrase